MEAGPRARTCPWHAHACNHLSTRPGVLACAPARHANQIRLLGYNAVRLPFTWRDLEMPPKNLHKDCTPVTVDYIKRRLISPHVLDKYMSKPLPGNVSPQKKRQARAA